MNAKVFFGRMTTVWTVKTQRKRIKPIRYKLVCEQNVFCYSGVQESQGKAPWGRRCDVRSYLKANYPKSLQFAHKITLAFEKTTRGYSEYSTCTLMCNKYCFFGLLSQWKSS